MTIAIIHISDLHFGREIFPATSRGAGAVARRIPVGAPGMLSHDVNALLDLEACVRRLIVHNKLDANPWDKRLLVVSGDLTAVGDDSEFALALTALQGELFIDTTRSVEFAELFDEVLTVPGNHDHWKARALHAWAFTTWGASPIHGKYFVGDPQSPAKYWWYRGIGSKHVYLQIAGVDSSAGPGANLLARGPLPPSWDHELEKRFSGDAGALGATPVARFLVTHHSLHPGGGFAGFAHGFAAQDEADLLDFARRVRLHRVLTGHLHEPRVAGDIELRCGTTLQSALFGRSPARMGWTFLLHELDALDNGKIRLTTHTYARTPRSGGFQRAATDSYTL